MFRAMRIITFFSLLVLCTLSFTLVFGYLVADVNSPPVAGGISFYKRELYGHSTDFSVLVIRQDGDSEDADPPDDGEAADGGGTGSPSPTPTATPSSQTPTVTPSAQTPTKTSAPAKTTQTPKETPSSSNSPASTPAPSSSQTDDDTTSSSAVSSTAPVTNTDTTSSADPSSSSSAQSSSAYSSIPSASASASSSSPSPVSNSVPSVSRTAQSSDSASIPPSTSSTPLSQPTKNVKDPSTTVSAAPTGNADDSSGFFHNKGAVAGTFASIGVIAAIVLGVAATSWIRHRRRARRQSDEEDAAYFEPKYPIGRTYSDLGQTNPQSREVGSGPLGASATDVAAVPATTEAYPDRAVHYGGYEPRTDVYMPTDYGISYPPGTSYEQHGSASEPGSASESGNDDAYDPYGTYSAPYEAPPPQREYQPSPLSGPATHPFADPANAIDRHPPTAYLHPQGGGAPDSMYAPSMDSFYGPSGSGHYPHAQ